MFLQGYLAHKITPPPWDTTLGLCLGSQRKPSWVGVFLWARFPCNHQTSPFSRHGRRSLFTDYPVVADSPSWWPSHFSHVFFLNTCPYTLFSFSNSILGSPRSCLKIDCNHPHPPPPFSGIVGSGNGVFPDSSCVESFLPSIPHAAGRLVRSDCKPFVGDQDL